MVGKRPDRTILPAYALSEVLGGGPRCGAGASWLPADLGSAVLGRLARRRAGGVLLSCQYRPALRGSRARVGGAPSCHSGPGQRALRRPGGRRARPWPLVAI